MCLSCSKGHSLGHSLGSLKLPSPPLYFLIGRVKRPQPDGLRKTEKIQDYKSPQCNCQFKILSFYSLLTTLVQYGWIVVPYHVCYQKLERHSKEGGQSRWSKNSQPSLCFPCVIKLPSSMSSPDTFIHHWMVDVDEGGAGSQKQGGARLWLCS